MSALEVTALKSALKSALEVSALVCTRGPVSVPAVSVLEVSALALSALALSALEVSVLEDWCL